MDKRFYSLAGFIFFSINFLLISCITRTSSDFINFTTVHGNIRVDDPLALALIRHPQFQRMKGIEQHGLNPRAFGEPSFTRFEHSIGVYALLKKHGATKAEQIAGLLHDVSHTAFSHVGDQFFGHEDGKSAWQDDNHEEFLKSSGLAAIAQDHGLSLAELNPKQASYKRLEQDLPTLCADRINYILHGAMILRLISPDRAKEIDDALKFDDKTSRWFFTDLKAAEDFSESSVWMTANIWGSPASFVATKLFIDALRVGIDKKILDQKDFRLGTDVLVWDFLEKSNDPTVLGLLKKVKNPSKHFTFTMTSTRPCTKNEVHQKLKLRVVDPYVSVNKKDLAPLSSLVSNYGKILSNIKAEIGAGYCLTYF
jgi:HD superfamily phosphohydrolase